MFYLPDCTAFPFLGWSLSWVLLQPLVHTRFIHHTHTHINTHMNTPALGSSQSSLMTVGDESETSVSLAAEKRMAQQSCDHTVVHSAPILQSSFLSPHLPSPRSEGLRGSGLVGLVVAGAETPRQCLGRRRRLLPASHPRSPAAWCLKQVRGQGLNCWALGCGLEVLDQADCSLALQVCIYCKQLFSVLLLV